MKPKRHPRQRGTVYLLVLVVTAMLVGIGVTAVMAGRVDLQTQALGEDQAQARLLAQGGLDLVRKELDADPNWRTSHSHDTWSSRRTVSGNNAGYRYKLVDEEDASLTDDTDDPARLYVEASVGGAVRIYSVVLRAGAPVTTEIPIARSSDDAGQAALLGINATTYDYVLIGQDGLVSATAAIRFDALPLGPGSTVLSAQVQFTSKDARSDATAISIQAQAADDAPTFNAVPYNISGRPKTSAQAVWAPGAWVADARGAEQLTPDLSAVMQEVIDRSGWSAGNAVAFFFEGTKARNPRTYDHSPAAAAVLQLTYVDSTLSPDDTTMRREMLP